MNRRMSTKRMVYLSLLMVLSIVLTRMLSIRIPLFGVEGIRIGIGGLPIIFAGVVFGPWAGGIVGALSDVVGFWVNPMGAYMPHFTLTSFLTGFIPGFIIFMIFRKDNTSYWKLLIAIGVGQTITSILLVPYFIHILFGAPYRPLLIPRLIGQPLHIIVYPILIRMLLGHNMVYDAVQTVQNEGA